MKKSEAIRIIANHIYELNVEAEECDKEAEVILDALLKAGMLPPISLEFTHWAINSPTECEWDSENEE